MRPLASASDEYTGSSTELVRTISCAGPALSMKVSPSSLVIAIRPLNATGDPMKWVGTGGRPPSYLTAPVCDVEAGDDAVVGEQIQVVAVRDVREHVTGAFRVLPGDALVRLRRPGGSR